MNGFRKFESYPTYPHFISHLVPNVTRTYSFHLVSDSTGETTYNLARACLVQFENIDVKTETHGQVRNPARLQRAIAAIEGNPGVVIYTMIDKKLSATLEMECARIGVPCIDVLAGVMTKLETYFNQSIRGLPGRQHQLDAGYFERIEAMQFTFAHDDGQAHTDLQAADIILVGVSRTSKTPTAIYLANQRGLKTANVPFVPGVPLPQSLFSGESSFIVGLTTSPERLVQIRRQRMRQLNEQEDTDYVDPHAIRDEVIEARKLFTKMSWPVIDVTRKSIEETSSEIIELYSIHNENLARSDTTPASDEPFLF